MFFYASKILSLFLFPYPLFLLVCLVALFRLPRGRFHRVFAFAFGSLVLLSTSLVSGALVGFLEDRHAHVSIDKLERADVVVVLSGMVNPLTGYTDRPEFLESADRILAGEEILRSGHAGALLISGGSGLMLQTGESEAIILRRWLLARGWPAERVLAEETSRNTAENAEFTARILARRGWKRVILVTSAFHMPRSVFCFREAGIEPVPFPVDYYRHRVFAGPEALVPSIHSLRLATTALKEYLGFVAYWLRARTK